MFPCLAFGDGYWWIFPVIMIAMMGVCFFMMRRHAGSMMCCQGLRRSGDHSENAPINRPLDILKRKNVLGLFSNKEYQEEKEHIERRMYHSPDKKSQGGGLI